jgi:hypothetical protein
VRRGARAFSLSLVLGGHYSYLCLFFLNFKKPLPVFFFAEPSSQRASDETLFFNTNSQQSDYKKSLGGIFGAATTPGR